LCNFDFTDLIFCKTNKQTNIILGWAGLRQTETKRRIESRKSYRRIEVRRGKDKKDEAKRG
jgi:hypothetical protein